MEIAKSRTIGIGLCLVLAACASSQKKLQQAKEKDPQYQYSMGAVYLNNNNLDEAIRLFRKALTLDPRHFQSLNALGLVYSIKRDLPEAEKSLLKCLEVSPNFSEARNNLGMVYQEMGFLDKAEEEFKKVTADANYASKELPYYNLARLYFLRQNWETALFYADRAIQANPRYHLGHPSGDMSWRI
jgi:tetratricopeptide (TPR) repeat protein